MSPHPADLLALMLASTGICWLEANNGRPTMALTDTARRTAKGRQTEYKLSDGGGLYLLVKPSGTRLWNQAYRSAESRRSSRTAPIRPYPSPTRADCAARPRSCCLGGRPRGQQEGLEADRRHFRNEQVRGHRRGVSPTHGGRGRRRSPRQEEPMAVDRSCGPRAWRPTNRGHHPAGCNGSNAAGVERRRGGCGA